MYVRSINVHQEYIVAMTAKQERFVSEYLIDLNATQAAIRAGYSEKTAQEQSSRLLSNVMVAKAVSEAQGRIAEQAEWSAVERLRMLAEIASRTKSDDPRVAVSAIAEANKMQGSHAPAKHEHSGPDGAAIQTETRTWREVLRSEKS